MLRDNNVVYCSEALDRPPPLALGFLTSKNRSIAGPTTRDNEALNLVIFYYGLCALKGFFTCRILINSGERF